MPDAEYGAGGAGVEGMPALGRERRRQARDYARWHALRGQRRLPLAEDFLAGAAHGDVAIVAAPHASWKADRSERPSSLAGELAERWDAVATAPAPLAFRLERGGVAREGLLLPLGDRRGGFAGFAVVEGAARRTASPPDGASWSAVASVPAVPRANPWDPPGSGATSLLGPRGEPMLPFATRLAAARTWAALGAQGPMPARASSLHAALCAAFGLLLSAPADRLAWEALGGGTDDEGVAEVVASCVFGDADEAALGPLALALAHGRRLGLDAGGFAALLGRSAGGHADLADRERRLRAGATAPDASAEDEVARDVLSLSPIDHAFLMRLARQASFRAAISAPTRAAA